MTPMSTTQKSLRACLVFALVSLFAACGQENGQKKPRPPTVVTTAEVQRHKLEILEESIGRVESETAPFVAAEVEGRIVKVFVDAGQRVRIGQVLAELDPKDTDIGAAGARAEVNRVEALLNNQERLFARYQKLVEENFISQAALEEEDAKLRALREELRAAQSQLQAAERSSAKTRITAPVSGRIEQRSVAVGDYVAVGTALFQISTSRAFRVHLPFPETAAPRLRPGLPVRLSTPASAKDDVQGRVSEIRPMIGSESRAIDVIVNVPNPGDWRPGASVNGAVVVAEREAITVPAVSVVLRPAGEVVYVVKDNKAEQRVVKTGARKQGLVEIVSGVEPGERVAVDGAAFLSDQAAVSVMEPRPAAEGKP